MSYMNDQRVDDTYDPDTAIEVDFETIMRVRQHGDVSALYTWNWAADNGAQPLLVLAPAWAPMHGDQPRLCCIMLSDAWKWSRTHNDDDQVVDIDPDETRIGGDQWQREIAEYFAACLRLSASDPATVRRIRGIIEDSLHDLVMMPPPPMRDHIRQDDIHLELTDRNTGKTDQIPLRKH